MLDPNDGYEAAGIMGWLARRAGSTEYEFQTSFPGSGTALAGSSDFYAADGKPKTKCAFSIDNDGYLSIAMATNASLVLGIRPVSSAQAFPGDDLLLQFSLTLKSTNKVANSGSVRDSDYVAVYDKKMLWRANLYIDEGTGVDWNELHPWNAPASVSARDAAENPLWGRSSAGAWDGARWGCNEWNKTYSFQSTFNIASMDNPSDTKMPGGQTSWLHPFIWPVTGTEKTGAVSYDYNGQDNPFVFDNKMDQQELLIGQFYNITGQRFKQPRYLWPDSLSTWTLFSTYAFDVTEEQFAIGDIPSITPYWDISLISDGSSLLPPAVADDENRYKNYIAVDEWGAYTSTTTIDGVAVTLTARHAYQDAALTEYPWSPDDDGIKESDIVSMKVNDIIVRPYLPGFNNGQFQYPVPGVEGQTEYISLHDQAGKAAGTDCVAFVMNSAGYDGDVYDVLGSVPDAFWDDGRSSSLEQITIGDDLWEICGSTKFIVNPATGLRDYLYLDKIALGDIVYYPGYHVMIVSKIDYNDVDTTSIDKIWLIESTYDSDTGGYVRNFRTVSLINGLKKAWIIGRMRME